MSYLDCQQTAFVTGFGLLDLAKHHGAQEKVHQEVLSLLPEKDSPITPKTLESMKYLKACVKESMRSEAGKLCENVLTFSS